MSPSIDARQSDPRIYSRPLYLIPPYLSDATLGRALIQIRFRLSAPIPSGLLLGPHPILSNNLLLSRAILLRSHSKTRVHIIRPEEPLGSLEHQLRLPRLTGKAGRMCLHLVPPL